MKAQLAPVEKQYRFLKVYTFFWWAFFAMVYVFESLFLLQQGFQIYQIFFNSAIAVLFSFFVMNFWSKVSDKTRKRKQFIILGNVGRVMAFGFLPFISNFQQLVLYTIVLNASPSSDAILISYIYKISDYLNPKQKKERPIYHKIHTYTEVRKFGSIGWAIALPFAGHIINVLGFRINFAVATVFLLILTLIFAAIFDEKLLRNLDLNLKPKVKQEKDHSIVAGPVQEYFEEKNLSVEKPLEQTEYSSLFTSISKILENRILKVFLISAFIIAIANAMQSTIFSIFNAQFTDDNYILLGLTWAFNAALEYPIMSYAAKRVEKIGWINVVILTYVLSAIRVILNPFLLFFEMNLIWIYLFQIINGFIFGLSWPAITLGLNINLTSETKALGLTLYASIQLFGKFIGNILGQILSFILGDTPAFYYALYFLATVISLIAVLQFKLQIKRERN